MKNNLQLVELSKQISSEYLNNNVPLNDSLEKIAETYALNKDELHRVAELANVDVYLQLIDKTDNKYLEFPLADYNFVYNKLVEKRASYKESNTNLYEDLKIDRPFSFEMYKTKKQESNIPALNKVASFIPRDSINDHLIEADKYKTCIQFIENSWFDAKGKIGQLIDDVYYLVKQACLSGTSFNDIDRVIKEYSPNLYETISSYCKENLKKETPLFGKFFKEAEYNDFKINEDNKLVKNLKEIEKQFSILEKIAEVHEHFVNEYNDLVSKYKVGFKKEAAWYKAWVEAVKKHPIITTGTITGIGGFIIGQQVGKNKEKNRPWTKEELALRMYQNNNIQ